VTPTTQVRVIDADSHLTEPADLWIQGLPAKWRASAPRLEFEPNSGVMRWKIGEKWAFGPGSVSHAGWKEFAPSRPPTWDEIDPACYSATERAQWMDKHGVTAQVLYPNLVAFEGHAIMALDEPELKLAIVRAYNDYLTDFAAREPGRFIPIACVPFWDREESIKEMKRCADMGHRGVLWAATLGRHGLPPSTDEYWDPFYAEAQELGMSINLHVGVGWTEEDFKNTVRHGAKFDIRVQTGRTALGFMSNANTISDLILNGVCERFPKLDFLSVESGFGWVPFVLESLDWHWRQYDGPRQLGGLLPSEYFERQIYSMFWFEESCLPLIEQFPNNVMFETDFPHSTSLSPGPGSIAPSPLAVVDKVKAALDPITFEKVMYGNAARVYRV
jgi:predicted TIM-barrel fold metal-dependent hydrolase